MGDKKPCQGCKERHLGCHDHCKAYQDFADELHAVKAAEREERARTDAVYRVKEANPFMRQRERDRRRGRG